MMNLTRTFSSLFAASPDVVQRIGIVAGMEYGSPKSMIYNKFLNEESTRQRLRTHIMLANTRKVYDLFDIVFFQQVFTANSGSTKVVRITCLSISRILTFAKSWVNQMHQQTKRRDARPSQRLLGHQPH